ncbi:hypothetical protein Efla_006202 [Eimeria flavescens]
MPNDLSDSGGPRGPPGPSPTEGPPHRAAGGPLSILTTGIRFFIFSFKKVAASRISKAVSLFCCLLLPAEGPPSRPGPPSCFAVDFCRRGAPLSPARRRGRSFNAAGATSAAGAAATSVGTAAAATYAGAAAAAATATAGARQTSGSSSESTTNTTSRSSTSKSSGRGSISSNSSSSKRTSNTSSSSSNNSSSRMALLRPLRAGDLHALSLVNGDVFTETFGLSFYLRYLSCWPELCIAAEGPDGALLGYIIGGSPRYSSCLLAVR